jgi:hypothetical protein
LYTDTHDEALFKIESISKGGLVGINESTYKTSYDINGLGLSDIDMFPKVSDFDIPVLRWVKDKNGEYYNLKGSSNSPAKQFEEIAKKTKIAKIAIKLFFIFLFPFLKKLFIYFLRT